MKQFLERQQIKVPNYVVINGLGLKKWYHIRHYKNKTIYNTKYTWWWRSRYLFIWQKNFSTKKELFEDTSKYIISDYISDSISINVHVFISESTNLVTPASVQLIENIENQLLYRGADFISFRDIDKEIQEKIRYISIKICNSLRNEGYKGIAGIDFIIDKHNNIYCSEINPRFQASTVLLSKYLDDRKKRILYNQVKYLKIYQYIKLIFILLTILLKVALVFMMKLIIAAISIIMIRNQNYLILI